MNSSQKISIAITVSAIFAMLAYPPFQVILDGGTVFNMGYGWLFSPPKRFMQPAVVNTSMLLMQWLAAVVAGAASVFLTKD